MANNRVANLGLSVTTSVASAITEMDKLSNRLKTIEGNTNKSTYALQKMSGTLSNFGRYMMTSLGFGSLQQSINSLTRAFTSGISEATKYVENYNLFNVALRGNTKDQLKFQYELNNAFKSNMTETLRYQGYFMGLSTSLGIANAQAQTMSKGLTKLTYDLASLYNVDVATSQSKLMSGLVGQTKPLRTLGIDVTMQSLQPYLADMGIHKKVSELTQAEKVLLRYVAIVKQSSIAHGDFSRTIESPANQMRIWTTQTQELTRWFGALFIGTISKVLPYMNGFIGALKEIFKWTALAFGFNAADYDYIGQQSDMIGDFEDQFDNATKASEKLKRSLYGFDELNNVTSPVDTGGTDSGMGSVYDILLKEISDYENGMSKIKDTAGKITESIMDWLGFTKLVNDETSEISYALEGFSVNLAIALAGLSSVGLGITTFLLTPLIKVIGWLFTLGSTSTTTATAVTTATGTVSTVTTGMAVVVGGAIAFVVGLFAGMIDLWNDTTAEAKIFRDTVGKHLEDFGKIAVMLWETVSPVFNEIGNAFIFMWEEGLKPFWEDFKVFAGSVLNLIMPIINGILVLANVIMTVLSPVMKFLVNSFATAFASISQMLGGFFRFVAGVIDLIIGLFTFDGNKIASGFFNIFTGIANTIYGFVSGVVNFVIDTINGFIKLYNNTAGNVFGKLGLLKKFSALDINTQLPSNTGQTLGGAKNSNIQMYADGGFPTSGQMFIAREAGAEMVGTIGGRTAVANNQDIVSAVSQGVASAVGGGFGGEITVNLNVNDVRVGRELIRSINKATLATGETVLV